MLLAATRQTEKELFTPKISKEEFSLTVTVSILVNNHHQTVTYRLLFTTRNHSCGKQSMSRDITRSGSKSNDGSL